MLSFARRMLYEITVLGGDKERRACFSLSRSIQKTASSALINKMAIVSLPLSWLGTAIWRRSGQLNAGPAEHGRATTPVWYITAVVRLMKPQAVVHIYAVWHFDGRRQHVRCARLWHMLSDWLADGSASVHLVCAWERKRNSSVCVCVQRRYARSKRCVQPSSPTLPCLRGSSSRCQSRRDVSCHVDTERIRRSARGTEHWNFSVITEGNMRCLLFV